MATQQKIYSVPRKLDLASLFVFTTGYGLLFAAMKLLKQDATAFLLVAGFFTSVGIAQAALFGGKAPRLASWLTGGAYFLLLMVGFGLYQGAVIEDLMNCGAICLFAFGSVCGYVAGTAIAGIFLVADKLRFWLRSRGIGLKEESDEPNEEQNESPLP